MQTNSRISLTVLAVSMVSWMAFDADAAGRKVRHPLVQRIDNLTWEDAVIKEYVSTLPEKKRDAIAEMDDRKKLGLLRTIQRKIKIRYVEDGGCVLAPPVVPVPWIKTKKQPLDSVGLLPCFNSLEDARKVAKKTGKPILLLSTELPGCSACTGHGRDQLSHPFVVDAAMEFVPVLVEGGWPYAVVTDAEGKELSKRMNHKVQVPEMLAGFRAGLRAAERDVPKWMELVTFEWNATKRATATFGMGCFWSGESKLGRIDGVLSTRVGSLKGEVVELEYDPGRASYEDLLKEAQSLKCASVVVARTEEQQVIASKYVTPERVFRMDDPIKLARDQGQKHGLGKPGTARRLVPMTELQATRLNSFGRKGDVYLSPSQRVMMDGLRALKVKGTDLSRLIPDRSREGFAAYANTVREELERPAKSVQ
jgi:hypothetical protein